MENLKLTSAERTALLAKAGTWVRDGFSAKVFASLEREDGTIVEFYAEKAGRGYYRNASLALCNAARTQQLAFAPKRTLVRFLEAL